MAKEITGTLSRAARVIAAEMSVHTVNIEANIPGTLHIHTSTGSGIDFKIDETLTLKDGVLSVNTTDLMERDNTLPITSAGVYATVGNIEALLNTI